MIYQYIINQQNCWSQLSDAKREGCLSPLAPPGEGRRKGSKYQNITYGWPLNTKKG